MPEDYIETKTLPTCEHLIISVSFTIALCIYCNPVSSEVLQNSLHTNKPDRFLCSIHLAKSLFTAHRRHLALLYTGAVLNHTALSRACKLL